MRQLGCVLVCVLFASLQHMCGLLRGRERSHIIHVTGSHSCIHPFALIFSLLEPLFGSLSDQNDVILREIAHWGSSVGKFTRRQYRGPVILTQRMACKIAI